MHHAIVYKSSYRGFALDYITSVHVRLFIIIAGYLCHKQPIKKYISKKIYRLLIPLWFFSALKILYSFLFDSSFIHGKTIISTIYEYFLVGSGYWFIYCLFFLYLLIIPVWKMQKKTIIGLTAVLASVNQYVDIIGLILPSVFQIDQILIYSVYFLIGYLVQQYKAELRIILSKKKLKTIMLCASFIIAFICDILFFKVGLQQFYLLVLVRSSARILILYFVVSQFRLEKENIIIKYLSKYSLQLMLLDSFYKVVLVLVFGKFIDPTGLSIIILSWILNMIAGVVTCLIVERVPGICTLFGLRKV